MLSLELQDGLLSIETLHSNDCPNIIMKLTDVYLLVRLLRRDTTQIVQMLKDKVSGEFNLTFGEKIIFDGSRLTIQSNQKSVSVMLESEDIQAIIKELEGWFDIVSKHPFVRHLQEYNIIKCESYDDLSYVMQILMVEGLKFRTGDALVSDCYKEYVITSEQPIYLARKQNTVYTDSQRLSDFVCLDFVTYADSDRVLSVTELKGEL